MRRIALAVVAALVALTACSAPADDLPEPSPSDAGEHNDADVRFAQEMIPHHAQAVEMADVAVERAATPEVKALAERIAAAQQPEIDLMAGWLRAWGEEVPDATGGHGGMGGDHMAGGMDPGEMAELMGASGATFDRMFLTMMTVHHEGAIEMARTLLEEGSHPDVQDLARRIIADQQAEIDEMAELLQAQ